MAQTLTAYDFEEASEFGEPVGVRGPANLLRLGYDYKDFDLAKRFTWKFLRDAPQGQIDAVHALAIEADSRNVFAKVMRALLNNVNRTKTARDPVGVTARCGRTSSKPWGHPRRGAYRRGSR